MSYRQDPVYRTVRWLRSRREGSGSFAALWAERAGLRAEGLRFRPGLTNYKPFERARVMMEVTLAGGVTWQLFLHVAPDREAAGRELAQYGGLDLCNGEHSLVSWTLPNAPELGALAVLLDPAGSFLATSAKLSTGGEPPRLVRYVPLKRALLVWRHPATGRRYWLKLINAAEAAAAALNLREIRAWYEHGAFTAPVPRLVHYSPDLRTLVMSEVPGQPFTDVMLEGRREPLVEAGRALAQLHGTPTVPWRSWSFAQEHAGLRRHMRGVLRALPGLAARTNALVDRLGASTPRSEAGFRPVHGNLFGDQMLFDVGAEPGRRVGFVDWDAWCHADPHLDLGRLLAHLVYAASIQGLSDERAAAAGEALLAGYMEIAGTAAVDRERLDWHLATALLLRAKISSVRKLAPGWPRHVVLMVHAAERVLERGAPARRVGVRQTRSIHPEQIVR